MKLYHWTRPGTITRQVAGDLVVVTHHGRGGEVGVARFLKKIRNECKRYGGTDFQIVEIDVHPGGSRAVVTYRLSLNGTDLKMKPVRDKVVL